MNSFLRRTVPAAFLAGGILLGGAGAAGAAPAQGVLGVSSADAVPAAQGFLGQVTTLLSGASSGVAAGSVAGTPLGVLPQADEAATGDVAAEESAAVSAGEVVAGEQGVTHRSADEAAVAGEAAVDTQAAAQVPCDPNAPGGCPVPPPPPPVPVPDCAGCTTTTVTAAPPAPEPTPVPETTTTAPPVTVVHEAPELPRTGSTVAPWVAAGAGLLLVGGAFVAASQRGMLRRGA